jgi:hypothetical protein
MARALLSKNHLVVCFVLAAFLSLGGLAACGGGGGSSSEDSEQPFTENACSAVGLKIANGQACSLSDNPAASSLVRLTILDAFGGTGICTGVAISETAILTAGHCFMDGFVAIQADTFTGSFGVSNVIVHPGFSAVAYEQGGVLVNDAALVFTDQAMGVAPSPLLSSRAPIVGEEAVIAGFGQTSPDSGTGQIFAGNAWVSSVTAQHVVIEYRDDQSHPCRGDSGGPLFVNVGGVQALTGVVSQSDPSVDPEVICTPGDITLYASVEDPSIHSFIVQYVPNVSSV